MPLDVFYDKVLKNINYPPMYKLMPKKSTCQFTEYILNFHYDLDTVLSAVNKDY